MIQRLALLSCFAALTTLCMGQSAVAVQSLPDAPVASSAVHSETQTAAQPSPIPPPSQSHGPAGPTARRVRLTLKEAETLVINNNPQITAARLQALAAQQVTRETRSGYWPTATANLTAVDSEANSRIAAGGLNNPIIFERAAGGAAVSQLITDFGHTKNLVASASFSAKAEDQNALATREQILLAVDQAFYGVLQAQAVLHVAEGTVANRQVVVDQVQALAKSLLKSDLDLSFAQVNLAQAKLLLLDAQNNEKGAEAALAALLGYVTPWQFDVVDEPAATSAPPANLDDLIQQAFDSRPELQAINFQYQSRREIEGRGERFPFPHDRRIGCSRRYTRAGLSPFAVVRRRRGQHGNPRLQRVSIFRTRQGSRPASASGAATISGLAQHDCERRPDQLAECQHRL